MASMQYEGKYLRNQERSGFIDISKYSGFDIEPMMSTADLADAPESAISSWQIVALSGAKNTKHLAHYTTYEQAKYELEQMFDFICNGDARQHKFGADEGAEYNTLPAKSGKNRGGVDNAPLQLSRPMRGRNEGNTR